MKKITQATVLLFAILTSSIGYGQVRFGLKGGLTSSNITVTNSQLGYTPDARLSWQGGILADIGINKNFSIQPAVLATTKGFKGNYTATSGVSVDYSLEPLYLEVPVLALLKINLTDAVRIYGGLGPYAAVGINGKSKVKLTTPLGTTSSTTDLTFGSDGSDNLTRTDFGASFALGVEIGPVIIGANYNAGLKDIDPDKTDDAKIRNASLNLTVGFLFGKPAR